MLNVSEDNDEMTEENNKINIYAFEHLSKLKLFAKSTMGFQRFLKVN